MKKKLEADLISIAHRILKLSNKSDIIQLHQETQKLYEKLSVLRFVEENMGDVKPTIGRTEIENKIAAAFDTNDAERPQQNVAEETQVETPQTEANASEPVALIEEHSTDEKEASAAPASDESVKENEEEDPSDSEQAKQIPEVIEEPTEAPKEEESVAEFDQPAERAGEISEPQEEAQSEPAKTEEPIFKPAFELAFEAKEIKEDAKEEFKPENAQITFEDILGSSYVDPIFVKPEDLERERETPKTDNVIPIGRSFSDSPVISINKADEPRSYSLNDRLSKGITIGLNDRVAFMKHLFNNSSEDYNRVLSQLITFDTFGEAKSFIDDMVKPDYNNWDGKDEYADRFMEIVEKKFS